MPEVFAIADTVTVLKDGRHVATRTRAETGADEVVRLMVGRPLSDYYPPRPADPPGDPVLRVEGGGNALLAEIDLVVRRGEIVAVAGLEGSGKTALARAVVGAEPFLSGRMWIGAKEARPGSVRAALSQGLGLVPGGPQARRAGADAVGARQRPAGPPRPAPGCSPGRTARRWGRRRSTASSPPSMSAR